ncbi:MAG: 16S rRNA (uracil(1498)-N(3))-methyltransferase [Deltaproteobacteria bacterium]|nr:16S rRNA (uracil(1498)-N(3))-methyltransferase [Deltaproteobacteria bacterium]
MHTFFLPAEAWHEPYQVTGTEARHLVSVLRIKRGDTVRLIDGLGREGIFTVCETGKRHASLTPETIVIHKRPPGITLAIGYGRGLRRGWLLEKAVELEAAGVWFWQADRSQGNVPEESKETWLSQMLAGAKQTGNPWLPGLATLPGGVDELIMKRDGFDKRFVLWEGAAQGAILSLEDLTPAANVLFALGPEGGFSEREITRLTQADFTPVSLGNRILRWETAAMLCLGLAWWARQQETMP